MKKENLSNFYNEYKREVIGTSLGILFGVLVITAGFWKTIFVAICGLLGFYLSKIYSKEELLKFLDRVLPQGKK